MTNEEYHELKLVSDKPQLPHQQAKIRFLQTPVVERAATTAVSSSPPIAAGPSKSHGGGDEEDQDARDGERQLPRFQRHDDASLLELFYDLFFAAIYNVFSQNQAITNHARFKAYIGYFSLMWLNWFVVTLYDARFVTDSIFERVARAIHLGVLVGFAVVTPKFNPSDQDLQTMRTMSLIQMVSRAALAVEYATVLYHVRKYKKARLPLALQTGVNIICALVYLGVTFRFRDHDSRVYITWYFLAGGEAIFTLLMSNVWEVLSLTKTHLMKRMTLLTILVLGDGIQDIATDVAKIVKTPAAWNGFTIGLITSAAAVIVFIALAYFDWLKGQMYLPPWRQQLWTAIHFPFHLAMTIFVQGLAQLVIMGKALDVMMHIPDDMIITDGVGALQNATTPEIVNNLHLVADRFFTLYPSNNTGAIDAVNGGIANMSSIPDKFWPQLYDYYDTGNLGEGLMDNLLFDKFSDAMGIIIAGMWNSLFITFGIDLQGDVPVTNKNGKSSAQFQARLTEKNYSRFALVFSYSYIAAGCTLVLMAVLGAIHRTSKWTTWPLVRLISNIMLGFGLGLVATLFFNEDRMYEFLESGWLIPTQAIVWFVVQVLTHIGRLMPFLMKILRVCYQKIAGCWPKKRR